MKPEFTQDALDKASRLGSEEVSEAMQKLSGKNVSVFTSPPKTITLKDSASAIAIPEGKSVVTYAQIMKGVPGVAFLIMTREGALTMADLLFGHELGTTGILKQLDRDALKEMLNILSNAYITSLSKSLNVKAEVSVPSLITSERIASVTESILSQQGDEQDDVIVFETTCTIGGQEVSATLHILYNEKLAEFMSE
jgi:chemotaxis protein CheY-P-specific phosphatase CheC